MLITIPGSRSKAEMTSGELILRLLSDRFSLTIAEIHRLLQSEYKRRLSYQAVRKLVRRMTENGVFEVRDRKYRLSKSWLLESRKLIDRALIGHSEPPRGSIMGQHDFATFQFDSLYKLDNFWGDRMLDVCAGIKTRPRPEFFSIGYYAWWLLFNLGREISFWRGVQDSGFKCTLGLVSRSPLNSWAVRVYSKVGVRTVLGCKLPLDESVYYNIIGDFVAQVWLAPDSERAIRTCFKRTKRIDDVKPKLLDELAHARHESRLTLITDPQLAETLRTASGLIR